MTAYPEAVSHTSKLEGKLCIQLPILSLEANCTLKRVWQGREVLL